VDPGLIWILAGLMLLGAELLLPGIYLVWIGLAALGTGILMLGADPGLGGAVFTFIALLAAGIFASFQIKRRGGPSHRVNAPEAGLAGRHGVVIAAEGAALRVRLGDTDWPARPPRGAAPPALGAGVRVEAVDGMVLVVRPDSPTGSPAGPPTGSPAGKPAGG
jgi:membrane protein implicated in regulation of membrane protease activity